jgi:3-deoxy-D-manno-octulosonic-acid transferase
LRLLYTIFIRLYSTGIRFASLYNPKAKLWLKGRSDVFARIDEKVKAELKEGDELIWFHCASLGEFEQGRPLMEKLKESTMMLQKERGLGSQMQGQPGNAEFKIKNFNGTYAPGISPVYTPSRGAQFKIILTFFSPSGYEVQKNYPGVDFVFYLPADTYSNAKRFVRMLPLKAAFFVKYEFWFNYLNELKKKQVPTFLVSGIFREDQYFFNGYGGWARKQLKAFTHFFLQDTNSNMLLNQFGFKNTTVSGDTRFDRVHEIAQNKKTFPLLDLFVAGNRVLIAGSTYQEDERLICGLHLGKADYKLILVPHEIDEEHLDEVSELFKSSDSGLCLLYSKATELTIREARILIIDNIGMLSSLYQYGHLAYIGGGFNEGIHNILEASTFGLPVIFGPDYLKNNEAIELLGLGGAFTIEDTPTLKAVVKKLLGDSIHMQKASGINKQYVLEKKGATDKILKSIQHTL